MDWPDHRLGNRDRAAAFERRLSKYPGILTFSPDDRKLATAPQGDAVQILDATTGSPVTTLGSPVGGTLALAFSRDGRWVATGDGDTVVRIHDAATGKEVASNREFLMVPLTVAFSADSASVYAASGDKFVTIIDAATGKTTRKLDRTTQPMQALDVSPDGKSIATVFMKSEDMTQPDHVVVRALDTWQPRLDWLPPTMPVGGGWTSDGKSSSRSSPPMECISGDCTEASLFFPEPLHDTRCLTPYALAPPRSLPCLVDDRRRWMRGRRHLCDRWPRRRRQRRSAVDVAVSPSYRYAPPASESTLRFSSHEPSVCANPFSRA